METLENVKSAYELERGKPMPTRNHAFLQKRILLLISNNYEGEYYVLPELNQLVSGEKMVPDLSVYAGVDGMNEQDELFASELPLTTIEIISPSQSNTELSAKVERYLRAGVKSCWIVLPEYRSIVLSGQLGRYQTFDAHETLRDPATGIELELPLLFG